MCVFIYSIQELNTFIQQKSDSKDIYNVKEISILNKFSFFFYFLLLSTCQIIQNFFYNGFHKKYEGAQLFSTLIIIRIIRYFLTRKLAY